MVQLIFQVCTTIKLQNFTEKVGHANQSFDDKLIKQQIFILLQCRKKALFHQYKT